MPRYRVTITEVITHRGTIEVEAESEEEAEELASAGGYPFEALDQRTADVFFDVESIDD